MLPAVTEPDEALARDLALLAADVQSIEEVAAKGKRSIDDVLRLMADPEVVQRVEAEASRLRLSGVIGQAKATGLRDKLIDLLAGKVNDESSPRLLIDALNVVKGIAAKDDDGKPVSPFQLVIHLGEAPVPQVINVQARELGEAT